MSEQEEKKVEINMMAKPSDVRARINKPLFDWVIENLCKNAVDAMSGVGVIDIYIERSNEGKVIVDIADTGKGIPKNILTQISGYLFSAPQTFRHGCQCF